MFYINVDKLTYFCHGLTGQIAIFAQRISAMLHKRKTQKNKSLKYISILTGIILLILIGITYFHFYYSKISKSKDFSECNHIVFADAPISPSDKLNDPNEIHLVHAEKNGLRKPFTTTEDFLSKIDSLKRASALIEVTENKFYQLKTLSHSRPYLIPEAVDMLNEIGYRFQKRLAEKKYNNYRFRLTSLLRTEETQNSLSHCNHNATLHSAHLYGTTVDISYKNFYNTKTDTLESSYEAVQTLTKVLVEMRQECKFLAVRERKQSCFHITVVVCQPLSNKYSQHFYRKMAHK